MDQLMENEKRNFSLNEHENNHNERTIAVPVTPSQFQIGDNVIYGLHGRAIVKSIIKRVIDKNEIEFYILEQIVGGIAPQKNKKPTSIWIPVEAASQKGLRYPLKKSQLDEIFALLQNDEAYFSLDKKWNEIAPELEKAYHTEGPQGLAKVAGYLHLLKDHLTLPHESLKKLHESVFKLLHRELADAMEQPLRVVEEEVEKRLEQKLRANS